MTDNITEIIPESIRNDFCQELNNILIPKTFKELKDKLIDIKIKIDYTKHDQNIINRCRPKWILVIERLPEKKGHYLIAEYIYGNFYVCEAIFDYDNKQWVLHDDDAVIAWMPLSEYHEEEKEDEENM